MKSPILGAIAIILIISVAAPVYANGPIKKLGRGVANVVTCPFELPKGMGDAKEDKGIFAGLTWGIFEGTVNVVKRAVVGVYEIVTFPLPVPGDYEPIMEDPEFFLEKEKHEGAFPVE
ncbi:MAG: exosortase system-associated protein, TIGR04073 family [Candidatus Omnitrophota bacterium]|nr:exosortase system-associated protein, TIGR04073 family [Candidatus Omnitrophota bacterium]